MLLTAGH